MDRLILDTGVLVATVRGRAAVPDDADIAIPAVAIAEYHAGVHLDPDAGRQAARRHSSTRSWLFYPVCDYDRNVAEHHADLLADTARAGRHRGPHDLIIAATARATARTILTTDVQARFDELPDVDARVIAQ